MEQKNKDFVELDIHKFDKMTEEFLDRLISAGVAVNPAIQDKEFQEKEKRKKELCFRCTKMLMQKYRKICYSISSFGIKVDKELDEQFKSVDSLLNYVDNQYLFKEKKMDERLQRLNQSRNLIDQVNVALTKLKYNPESSMYYEALKYKYIDAEKLSSFEASQKMGIGETTYKRYIKQGLEELSTLLWTTSDVELSVMIEALSRLG